MGEEVLRREVPRNMFRPVGEGGGLTARSAQEYVSFGWWVEEVYRRKGSRNMYRSVGGREGLKARSAEGKASMYVYYVQRACKILIGTYIQFKCFFYHS